MATASSLRARGGRQNAFDSIAASTTDSVLVAAVPKRRIRVVTFIINQGDTTPSTVTFNSKGAGAGTAIAPPFKFPANGGIPAPATRKSVGFFQTNAGEALTVTTGAGSTTSVVVVWEPVD